jgi:hypothetical protein
VHARAIVEGHRHGSAGAVVSTYLAELRCHDADEARRSLALGADAFIWQGFGKFQLYTHNRTEAAALVREAGRISSA